MKRILVPIDFSPSSENALKYAFDLSKHLGMQLKVLYVFPKEEYTRKYDFGEEPYSRGIEKKLKQTFTEACGKDILNTRFLAREGGIGEEIISQSKESELLVLSGNVSSSSFQRFFGKRSSTIAINANCPVLLVPPTISFSVWENIWHIERDQNEASLLEFVFPKLKIKASSVQKKSFNQSSFTSSFWKKMVSYWSQDGNDDAMEKSIFDARQNENIDLVLLVVHQEKRFQRFLNDAAKHSFFKYGIAVMIVHEKNILEEAQS